jgi:hypothetical protein
MIKKHNKNRIFADKYNMMIKMAYIAYGRLARGNLIKIGRKIRYFYAHTADGQRFRALRATAKTIRKTTRSQHRDASTTIMIVSGTRAVNEIFKTVYRTVPGRNTIKDGYKGRARSVPRPLLDRDGHGNANSDSAVPVINDGRRIRPIIRFCARPARPHSRRRRYTEFCI